MTDIADDVDIMDPEACLRVWPVRLGDRFELVGPSGARHSLACGSATDAELRAALSLGMPAVLVTDPPYGMAYKTSWRTSPQGSERKAPTEIKGDAGDLDDASWLRVWRPNVAAYVWAHWRRLSWIADAMASAGMNPKHRIVWDKCIWGSGNLSQYGSIVEDCVVWMRPDHKIPWAKREGNLWRVASKVCTEGGRVGHPTQKPLGVVRPAVLHACPEGGVVADPFNGSGTTIVATEQVGGGRRCVAVELDPKFCALTLERVHRLGFEVLLIGEAAPSRAVCGGDGELVRFEVTK